MKTQITVYGTLGCHLCEVAKHMLQSLQQACNFDLVIIDIAELPHDEMMDYAHKIPVLKLIQHNVIQQLNWPFTVIQIHQLIN